MNEEINGGGSSGSKRKPLPLAKAEMMAVLDEQMQLVAKAGTLKEVQEHLAFARAAKRWGKLNHAGDNFQNRPLAFELCCERRFGEILMDSKRRFSELVGKPKTKGGDKVMRSLCAATQTLDEPSMEEFARAHKLANIPEEHYQWLVTQLRNAETHEIPKEAVGRLIDKLQPHVKGRTT